jgi:hypothetical protein
MKKKTYEKPTVTTLGDVVEKTLGDGNCSEQEGNDGYMAVWIGMNSADNDAGIKLRPKHKR